MESLKIYYDEQGKTLTVWFDNPQKEFLTEEISEEVALIKDEEGHIIGVERLNYSLEKTNSSKIEFISV